ncbi:bifunctional protein-serine/threonine kinase/phosphatase [Oceanobacter sp. 5_MG-2023]|uniref:bifunctional protein-serine/threonine kinase/phosphatase n=1 Tax=Oceanobacter sp. 5_MG-2023 TaxID=3062645 RepID=UPI0026E3D84E|nr:bifunctional protein-serine/threonine kinase/phosphatase [Oceanobacter sp. 5_MG-2023]MDO6681677.1 bifunctional protein-serine/threonine kinase/phosphatase [Oceanobacter sp. 5_MG-2023]
MAHDLCIAAGQYSDKGLKNSNQDSLGLVTPAPSLLAFKGVSAAIADGISSSNVSHIASQTAIDTFLEDYYRTSEAWTAQHSGEQVIRAINGSLYLKNQRSDFRFDINRGYVCTLSALVLRGCDGYVFHVGDSRIYRLREQTLEQLTSDHRLWESSEKSYLARAIGMSEQVEIDYRHTSLQANDVFILATDGVYEYVTPEYLRATIHQYPDDLNHAATLIARQALDNGSDDNLSIQLIRVTALPDRKQASLLHDMSLLALPPGLEPGMTFDGYRIIRNLHTSSRSHVFLARHLQSNDRVVLKLPSGELQQDAGYLERLMMEEWIARRIQNAHVIQPYVPEQPRQYLYIASRYFEGQTLTQWLQDNPRPTLEQVRHIIDQIARGLRAFHRLDMLHQDIKPDNVMIDAEGRLMIIDFGSTIVRGLAEIGLDNSNEFPGTALYMAPEYFLGQRGQLQSDQFSLGVLAYHMLTGQFPYGVEVARCQSVAAQKRLRYRSILVDEHTEVPAWVDDAIQKATCIDPYKRYEDIFEFVHDLRTPNQNFLNKTRPPLMARNPVLFWQSAAALELLLLILLAHQLLVG